MSNVLPITVSACVQAPLRTVWNCYTLPEHIVGWNFAHPSWHCPAASNHLVVGGEYRARMEARDGSTGFDFVAHYTQVSEHKGFSYEFGGRAATVAFNEAGGCVEVKVTFEPETENDPELQRAGWQAILDNFKRYAEGQA